MNDVPIAMQIIVKDTKEFTPLELAHASTHAVLSYLSKIHSKGASELFLAWAHGEFRKVLRRARGASWNKIIASAEGYLYENSKISMFIIAPDYVSNIHPLVKKAQVSHLTTIPDDLSYISDSDAMFTIYLNESAGMSPAKQAVASSHVAQMMLQFPLTMDDYETWSNKGFPIRISTLSHLEDKEKFATVAVRDNGHTEVSPNTLTGIGIWGSNPLVSTEKSAL